MSKPKRKSNIAKATESAVAFGPQHIELIRDRLGEIQGKIYLAANLAHLIAPDSEEDIEMHTVLCHISDFLQNVASDLDSNWVLSNTERAAEVANG